MGKLEILDGDDYEVIGAEIAMIGGYDTLNNMIICWREKDELYIVNRVINKLFKFKGIVEFRVNQAFMLICLGRNKDKNRVAEWAVEWIVINSINGRYIKHTSIAESINMHNVNNEICILYTSSSIQAVLNSNMKDVLNKVEKATNKALGFKNNEFKLNGICWISDLNIGDDSSGDNNGSCDTDKVSFCITAYGVGHTLIYTYNKKTGNISCRENNGNKKGGH